MIKTQQHLRNPLEVGPQLDLQDILAASDAYKQFEAPIQRWWADNSLVDGLEHLDFCFHILEIIIPADELIFFTGVETTNQIMNVDINSYKPRKWTWDTRFEQ